MFQRLGSRPQKPAPHHRAEIILARCAAYSASVRSPSLAVFVAVAALCTEAKAKREYTPEEKAARKAAAKEAMLKKTGGIIVKPDTRKGVIAFIDTQSRLSETNIRFVVDALAAKTRYDIRYVKSGQGDPLSLKASYLSSGKGIVLKPKVRRASFFCFQTSADFSFSSSRLVRFAPIYMILHVLHG